MPRLVCAPSGVAYHPQDTISDSSTTSLTKSKSLNRRILSSFERVKEKPKKLSKLSHDIKRELTGTKREEIKKIFKKVEREKKETPVCVAVVGSVRRRSFCCTETKLGDIFSRNGVMVVSVRMPPFMQVHAVDFARKACDSLEKFTAKTLASTLKKV